MDRRLRTLPVDMTPWELAVIAPPFQVDDVPDLQLLLVVDGAGKVRGAAPQPRGTPVLEEVIAACVSPMHASPCRPHVVRITDTALTGIVAQLGASAQVVDALPGVDAVMQAMGASLGEPAPAVQRPEAWFPVLDRLQAAAPWERMSDGVQFRFQGGPPLLSQAVGMVIGLAGEQRGLAIFEDEDAHARFIGVALGLLPQSQRDQVLAWSLHIDDEADLDAGMLAALRAVDMVRDPTFVPQWFALDQGELRALSVDEEDALRAATEAVLGLVERRRVDLDRRPDAGVVHTSFGSIEVIAMPGRAPAAPRQSVVFDVAHLALRVQAHLSGERREALVVKAAKRDATRMATHFRAVDALSLEDEGDATAVRAWAGTEDLGLLTRLHGVAPGDLGLQGEVAVVISAGGAKRQTLRDQDMLLIERATMLDDASAVQARRDSPTRGWPKSSATLLAFVQPLMPDPAPIEAARGLVELGSLIWNGVVLMDQVGDPEMLDHAREAMLATGAPRGLIDHLVDRKRGSFGDDPRLIQVQEVREEHGQLRVVTQSSLPPGITLPPRA